MSRLLRFKEQAGGLSAAIAIVTASAAAAVVALTANGMSQAGAAEGDPLVLGQANWSDQTTYLNWQRRVYPQPDTGLAVVGELQGGIFATNEEYVGGGPEWIDGIRAFGNDRGGYLWGVNYGVVADSPQIGVSIDAGEIGLEASGGDVGVDAVGGDVGLKVEGSMAAIEAQGAVSFSSAGIVRIPLGASSSAAVKPGTDVQPSSMVLATAQTLGGQVLRVARSDAADTIRIHLTAPATQNVRVAYFVIG